jgi:hypothetical protein
MKKHLTPLERARRYVAAISGSHGQDATFAVAVTLRHGFALSEEARSSTNTNALPTALDGTGAGAQTWGTLARRLRTPCREVICEARRNRGAVKVKVKVEVSASRGPTFRLHLHFPLPVSHPPFFQRFNGLKSVSSVRREHCARN